MNDLTCVGETSPNFEHERFTRKKRTHLLFSLFNILSSRIYFMLILTSDASPQSLGWVTSLQLRFVFFLNCSL